MSVSVPVPVPVPVSVSVSMPESESESECATKSMSVSVFANVELGPPIEVFAVTRAFNEDKNAQKANLGVGAYRCDDGKPWVLPVVRKVEKQLANDETINHEYLPVCGAAEFTRAATTLLLGNDSKALKDKRAFGVQALSGTGALRLGAAFLCKQLGRSIFYYSNPTWENHHKVFMDAGFKEARTYRYWDQKNRCIDFDGMKADLNAAPAGSVIILHACAHNPTGIDPTHEQWTQLMAIIKVRQLFPFFDSAYQGFASGDPDRDAWSVRHFVDAGLELFCAQSFAKNFGLYCERAGNLIVVQKSESTSAAVASQLTLLVRGSYSNPPAFGSRIVAMVLNDATLRNEWMDCIRTMSSRIIEMRRALHRHLVELKTPGKWDHIVNQIGMFSYTGLDERHVLILRDEYHIYLLKTGRISMCGINTKNVEYIAKAIHAAVTSVA